MNKLKLFVLALVLGVSTSYAALNPRSKTFDIPLAEDGGGPDVNNKHAQDFAFNVGRSTPAYQVVLGYAGAGLVDALYVSSGPVMGFCTLWDIQKATLTASGTGWNSVANTVDGVTIDPSSRILIQGVYSNYYSSSNPVNQGGPIAGVVKFDPPMPFYNGVIAGCTDVGINMRVLYRKQN